MEAVEASACVRPAEIAQQPRANAVAFQLGQGCVLGREFTAVYEGEAADLEALSFYSTQAVEADTFGGFIALTAWMPTYWTGAFGLTAIQAGVLTAVYSVLTSLIRILGGVVSDKLREGGENNGFAHEVPRCTHGRTR